MVFASLTCLSLRWNVQPMGEIWQGFLNESIALPMLLSLATGLLIGFEREVRAKPAGLRTHTLVCFASTILMLAAARQGEWAVGFLPDTRVTVDPTRMAHGILTGIGFLGAGVIFREGVSIHGLTTAASLWTTSAIGILYGVGMNWLGVSAALGTLVILVFLRLIDRLIPETVEMRLKVAAAAGSFDATSLRSLLSEIGVRSATISRSRSRDQEVELATRIYLRGTKGIDELASRLHEMPEVRSFTIIPAEDDPSFYRSSAD